MSTKAAPRRPLAGLVAIVVAASALAIIPINLSAANAIVTPNENAISYLDAARADAPTPEPDLLRNGYVDDYAQTAAVNYAACGGCLQSVLPSFPLGYSTMTIDFAQATGGTLDGRPARLVQDYTTNDSSNAFAAGIYGSIGFYTKGTTSYSAYVTFTFSSTPTNESHAGTVKLPSVVRVGVPVVPVISGFLPYPNPGYTYKWYSNGVNVSNSSTYTPTGNDYGFRLQLVVGEQNAGYSAVQTLSALSTKVVAGIVHYPSSILVEGFHNVNSLLGVPTSGWSPVVPTVQWYRNGVKIAGATGQFYAQTVADLGKHVSAKLTDAATGYTTLTRSTSTTITTGYPRFGSVPTPTIAGSPIFGQTLTANAGSWGPGVVALKYQWREEGVAIPGATHSTLLLGGSLLNQSITVTVTGTEAGYATQSASSAATEDVRLLEFINAATVSINGNIEPGSTVSVSQTTWLPSPTLYLYQWYVGGSPVVGAIHSTYKISATSAGDAISVSVIAFRADYQPYRSSSATSYIAP